MCSVFTETLTSMIGFLIVYQHSTAAVQAEDVHVSFLFVGDLNGHHQEWLGSKTTNRYGVTAFYFTTVGMDVGVMDVGVNWLSLCQECHREVFWARYCSFYTTELGALYHTEELAGKLSR